MRTLALALLVSGCFGGDEARQATSTPPSDSSRSSSGKDRGKLEPAIEPIPGLVGAVISPYATLHFGPEAAHELVNEAVRKSCPEVIISDSVSSCGSDDGISRTQSYLQFPFDTSPELLESLTACIERVLDRVRGNFARVINRKDQSRVRGCRHSLSPIDVDGDLKLEIECDVDESPPSEPFRRKKNKLAPLGDEAPA